MNRLPFLNRIDRKYYRILGWISIPILLMLLFFLVNQLALWRSHIVPITDTSSMMDADYKPWLYQSFLPVDKNILDEIELDSGIQINDPQPNETQGWFWQPPDDDDRTPTPIGPSRTPTASPTASATTIPTDTSIPTDTPTPSNTPTPTTPPILPTWTPSPTPINAKITISKTLTSAGSVENYNPPTSFGIVTYEIVLTNTGSEDIGNVRVTDDLDTVFGAGTYSNVTVSTTGTLTANGAYDGSSETQLLNGNQTLSVGVSETITLSFQIDTVSGGEKTNTAKVKGKGVISNKNISSSNSASVQIISTEISVTKTRTSAPAVPNGSTVVFSIVVSNPGNDDLNNIQVEDDLSATFGAGNYSITSVSTTGLLTPNGGYNGNSNTNLFIPNQTLLVGDSETITLTLQINTVPATPPQTKTNTAVASGTGSTLSIYVTATDFATVTIQPASISVSKTRTSSPASVPNGSTITYDILVTNNGFEDLNNVQVTDDLDTTFGAGTYTVTSVTAAGTTLTANWPGYNGSGDPDLLIGTETLSVGASETITLSVLINSVDTRPPISNTKTNTANASGTAAASSFLVTSTNSDTVDVLPPDISVSKTLTSPYQTANGNTVTYSIVVDNTGAEDLNNVQVTDNLDTTFGAGTYTVTSVTTTGTYLTANWPGYSGTGNLLLGNQPLPTTASETITLLVQLNTVTAIPSPKTNTAIADGIAAVSSLNVNDSNTANVNVQPPDISVSKSLTSSGSVPNGTTVVYSIVVTNSGAEDLNNVQVVDDLNTTFGAGTYTVTSVTTTGTYLTANWPGYSGTGNLLLGTQPLPISASETITLNVQLNTVPTVPSDAKTNTANASGTAAVSFFPVIDSDGADVTVLPPAISVTKTRTSTSSVPNGSTVVYSIVVSNSGAEDLNNVQVTDNLDTAFGAGTYTVTSVTAAGTTLTANWPGFNGSGDPDLLLGTETLAVGASETITLSVQINSVDTRPPISNTKTNTAFADGTAAASSFYVSDTDDDTVTVLPPAISVTKTRTSSGTVANGDTVSFSIVVTNTGAEILNNVQVTDSLNAAFGAGTYSNVSVSTTGTLLQNPGFSGTGGLLLGGQSLGIGASETITLSLQIDSVTGGTKTNTANARGDGAVSSFLVTASDSATVTVAGSLYCPNASLTNFTVVGSTVSWDVNNNSGSSFDIDWIIIGWPTPNGNLVLVTLGGNTIWSGSDDPQTASITATGNTTVGAGSPKTIRLYLTTPAKRIRTC